MKRSTNKEKNIDSDPCGILWREAIQGKKVRGYVFRRNMLLNGMTLDFYCGEIKHIVEIIGNNGRTISESNKRIKKLENLRDTYVITYLTKEQIMNDIESVKKKLHEDTKQIMLESPISLLNGGLRSRVEKGV